MSDKTEKPTEKKRKDSRKEGQVCKSSEVTSCIQLITIFLFFHSFAQQVVYQTINVLQLALHRVNEPFLFSLVIVMQACRDLIGWVLMYLGGMLAVTTIITILMQVGLLLATKAVGFKGSKISPVQNLKQIVSINSLVELLKSVLKLTLLAFIFYCLFLYYFPTFQSLPYCTIDCALPVFFALTHWIWLAVIAFYVVLSVMDYAFQHHQIMKQLRMSKQDVIKENKDREGNPEIKNMRRELHREIQSGSLAHNVKRSTIIVRNPTHIAICLNYHPTEMPVPQVVEKGRNARAAHIVCLAAQFSVPVVENIPLAHQLYNEVGCGETIPETLFEPVAALLRLVLKIDYETECS
ncbi:EscU/YscU/HrcU family type III secretion system export apparatus switch protein [unidentified bacterial endosymbiont]|uniref:EscU/YscU/HrcU family type III secretion system export apparatus switch protein n=1 Tax=unidentified bacterial endosymbiont TaxID=2355 RepID=UPI0020A0045C|nr:EscU/YscU/HrcU family type III secretion system export apparatus switch protein [unidentified bacterial endosymbiont]